MTGARDALAAFLSHLANERRASPRTIEAYGANVSAYLSFLEQHHGGALSLGHPVGCSGNRIVLHLVNAMKRLGTRRGIATECIGGGLGGAMLIETVCPWIHGS